MGNTTSISGYEYSRPESDHAHEYLLPAVERCLQQLGVKSGKVFDLGCGNGFIANWFAQKGHRVAGVDPSTSGIDVANSAYPNCDLRVGSCYDPLATMFGQFRLVVSLEVVEHVYAPREYARCVYELLEPGGHALISTPYHGYFKNLALAVTGKLDKHFTALWDHGHIKFWSPLTLTTLLREAGLEIRSVTRIGRIPVLAKSMLISCERAE